MTRRITVLRPRLASRLPAIPSRGAARRHGTLALGGLLPALLLGLWGALAAPTPTEAQPAATEVDAFSERLYQRARVAERLGEMREASRLYEIACFGMLEAPERLAACLTHLALVEAARGDEATALDAARRLLEVERRFEVFDEAPLEAGLRSELITLFSELVPYALLADVPAFRDAARTQQINQIRALDIAERRPELDRRVAYAPGDWVWRLLWAELELEANQPAAAITAAERVLELRPGLAAARCIRGKAQAAGGSCSEPMIEDLVVCRPDDLPPIRARLDCWTRLGRWREALDTFEELPSVERETRKMERQQRRLQERLDAAVSALESAVEADSSVATGGVSDDT